MIMVCRPGFEGLGSLKAFVAAATKAASVTTSFAVKLKMPGFEHHFGVDPLPDTSVAAEAASEAAVVAVSLEMALRGQAHPTHTVTGLAVPASPHSSASGTNQPPPGPASALHSCSTELVLYSHQPTGSSAQFLGPWSSAYAGVRCPGN
jgi:hypothetical protein